MLDTDFAVVVASNGFVAIWLDFFWRSGYLGIFCVLYVQDTTEIFEAVCLPARMVLKKIVIVGSKLPRG